MRRPDRRSFAPSTHCAALYHLAVGRGGLLVFGALNNAWVVPLMTCIGGSAEEQCPPLQSTNTARNHG